MRYRVMAFVGERLLPSSCAYSGPKDECEAAAYRLNGIEGAVLRWAVLPCVD